MDRKQLTTALAAVGIVFVLVAVGLRLWANSERNGMPQLAMVHVGPDGGLYTMLADTLYIDDADGNSKSVIPLSRFGIGGFWGDFAVLADGSIILPAGKQPPDSAQKEARIYANQPVTASADAVSLTRCTVADFKCTPLVGDPASDYFRADRVFKLALDETAGRLYVADTAGQRLLILDLQGRILAQKTDGFSFPNQIELPAPGELDVADTDDQEVQKFDVSADKFAPKGAPEFMTNWSRAFDHGHPVGLATDEHGGQWVLLTDGTIRHGFLYRLPQGETVPKRVPLPAAADVLSLTAAGYHVLAPDQALYAIHAFSLDGESLPDAGSDTLQAALAGYASTRRLYDALFDYSLTALLAVLALLFLVYRVMRLYGWGQETEGEEAAPLPAGTTQAPAMAWSGREFVFRRRMGGLLSPASRKRLFIIVGCFAAFPVGVLLWFQYQLAQRPHPPHLQAHAALSGFWNDPENYAMVALTIAVIVYYWLSSKYERLYVSHTGLRYTSWLGGPLSLLQPFYPGWELRWDDLTDIRLTARGRGKQRGRNLMYWYYQLTPRQGPVRKLGAASWRLEGETDYTNLTLRQAFKRDPAVLKAVMAQTRLFRLLDLAMRARKAQFQHPLIEE